METECKDDRNLYAATAQGIATLRSCVSALEAYATQVRAHEKESYRAHGKYRRAFIQTYALLKSVIDSSNNQLYGFKQTFESNHTKAAKYLQKQLMDIKEKTELNSDKKDTIDEADAAIVEAKDALESGTKLLEKAMEELEKLKAMCLTGEGSFAERKKQREEEIKALKGAKKILADWKDF